MRLNRLLPLLTLFALLLAPAGMLGSHAAMAMPHDAAVPAMSHCGDQQQAPDADQRMIDCAIACSAMPSAHPWLPAQPLLAAPTFKIAFTLFIEGMRPEAATPPPRTV